MNLYDAARTGSMARVIELLEQGVDVNATFSLGFSALHSAAGENRAKVIQLLISRGAKVDARSRSGYTPLFMAVIVDGDHRDAIRALLERGADPSAVEESEDRETPLSMAKYRVEIGRPYAADHLVLLQRKWKKKEPTEDSTP